MLINILCFVDNFSFEMALLDALLDQLTDGDESEEENLPLVEQGDGQVDLHVAPIERAPSGRRQVRANDCLFCQTNCDHKNFENHLRTSPMCLSRYQRRLSVRTLDSILVHSLYCLFCPSKGPQKLHYHLEQNSSCLNLFCERFDIDFEDQNCIRRVTKKVAMLKKEGYPSRSQKSRKKENLKRVEDRCGTLEDALNQFKNKTTFGNIFKCILCACFKFSNEVIEVDDVDAINLADLENLEQLNTSKRNGKFWKCIGCDNSKRFQFPDVGTINFSVKDTSSSTVFAPILTDNEQPEGPEGPDGPEGIAPPSQPPDKQIKVFLPSSIESLRFFEDVSAKTQKDMDLLLYSGVPFSEPELKVLYQNQLSKFKSAKMKCDLFFAKKQLGEEKKLSTVKPQTRQSHIQGSEAWKFSRQSDRSFMMKHLGQLCLKLEIKIPLDSEGVIASCLIQEGHVVTASHESTESHEMCTIYYVHEGRLLKQYFLLLHLLINYFVLQAIVPVIRVITIV